MGAFYGASGTTTYGSTSNSPGVPSGVTAGQKLIIAVGVKPDSATVTTPTGYTFVGEVNGGFGLALSDQGPCRLYFFERVATADSGDTPGAITCTGASASAAQIHRFTKDDSSGTWEVAFVGAADTSGGTSNTVTMSSDPGITVGDTLLIQSVIPTDVSTPTQFASQTVQAAGLNGGSAINLTEIVEWDTTTGNDLGGWTGRVNIGTGQGTSSGNATVTATASGTTTNVGGPIGLVRIREIPAPRVGSESNSLAVSESNTTNVSFSTSESNSLSVAEVVDLVIINNVSANDEASVSVSENTDPVVAGLSASDSQAFSLVEGRTKNFGPNNLHPNPSAQSVIPDLIESNVSSVRLTDGGWSGNAYVQTQMVVDGSGNSWFWDYVPIRQGETYTVAIRYRFTSGTASSFRLALRRYNTNGTQTGQDNISISAPTSSWQTASYTFTAAADEVGLRVGISSTGGGTALADTDGAQVNQSSSLLDYDDIDVAHKVASESNSIAVSETSSVIVTPSATDSGSLAISVEGKTIAFDSVLNLYSNPSFEGGASDLQHGNASSVVMNDGTAYSGRQYVKTTLVPTGGLAFVLSDFVPVTQSTTMRWSVRVRTSGGTKPSDLCIMLRQIRSGFGPLDSFIAITPTGSWANATFTTTTGPFTEGFRIGFVGTPTDNYIIEFDAQMVSLGSTSQPYDEIPQSVTAPASESNAFAVAETTTIDVSLSVTDTGAITISEEASIEGATTPVEGSESNSLAASESTTILVTTEASESNSISVSDAASTTAGLESTDSGSIALSDSSVTEVSIISTDTGAIAIADVSELLVTLSASETNSIAVDDADILDKTIPASESNSLAVAESNQLDITDFKLASESNSLAIDESVETHIGRTASDSHSLAVSETSQLEVYVIGTDSIEISLSDTSAQSSTFSTTDDLTFLASESRETLVGATVTDQSDVSVLDVSAILKQIVASDTCSVVVEETTTLQVGVSDSDAGSLALTEEADIAVVNALSAIDSGSISVSESVEQNINPGSNDQASIGASSEVSVSSVGNTSDIASVAVSESQSITVAVTAVDSASLSVSENVQTDVSVTVVDSLSVLVTENRAQESTLSSTDTGAVIVFESAQVTLSLTTNDTSGIALSDSSHIDAFDANVSVSSSDTVEIGVGEFRSIKHPGEVSENIHIGGSVSVMVGYLETERESGTMVNEDTRVDKSVGGKTEIERNL